MINMDRKDELFDNSASTRIVSVIVETKATDDGSLAPSILTKNAFQEMIDWEIAMFNVTIYDDAIVND